MYHDITSILMRIVRLGGTFCSSASDHTRKKFLKQFEHLKEIFNNFKIYFCNIQRSDTSCYLGSRRKKNSNPAIVNKRHLNLYKKQPYIDHGGRYSKNFLG